MHTYIHQAGEIASVDYIHHSSLMTGVQSLEPTMGDLTPESRSSSSDFHTLTDTPQSHEKVTNLTKAEQPGEREALAACAEAGFL